MSGSRELSTNTDTPVNNDANANPQDARKKHIALLISSFALLNGVMYFFVASAGVNNIRNAFDIEDPEVVKDLLPIGIGASFCYGMFAYKLAENISLLPTSPLSKALTALAPIAASKFLTAGIEGANIVSENWGTIPTEAAIGIGLALYVLRGIAMIDGSVKFPSKIAELKTAFTDAISNKDYKEITRIIVTVYTALGFAISSTDAVYAAIATIAKWLGGDTSSLAVTIPAYTASVLGSLGLFPLTLYWTLRGIRQATFGGKPNADGTVFDPTDKHTLIGGIGTVPVILGLLGSVTSSTGQVFGRLGTTATVVRVSSSAIYAVAGGIPGLSTLSRNVATLYNSRRNPSPERDLESQPILGQRKEPGK